MKKFEVVLKEALESIEPSKKKIKEIDITLKEFLDRIKKRILLEKISADIFVGGSYAKKTLVKKDIYDIDIFVRFNIKHSEDELSKLTEKILQEENAVRVHGSRDYFRVNISDDLFFEIIPVKKIKNPKDAENITDLSYSHVNYIRKNIKSQKVLEGIKLAKVFCYANKCYGAESYINGFSGYGLELLIYYYGDFIKFLRSMLNVKDKLIIDIEKQYKNKQRVLMDINSAKLKSPIILIDPTYKQRNVLAALSKETFLVFQEACKNFLKKPDKKCFEFENLDFEKLKKSAKAKKFDSIFIEVETVKQEGDVAGSKLLKFCRHLKNELIPFFEIKDCGFEYGGSNKAKFFFATKTKKEFLKKGPLKSDLINLKKFKSGNKNTFFKGKRIYAMEKVDFHLKDFIRKWVRKNKRKMSEMYISDMRFLE